MLFKICVLFAVDLGVSGRTGKLLLYNQLLRSWTKCEFKAFIIKSYQNHQTLEERDSMLALAIWYRKVMAQKRKKKTKGGDP